LAASKSLPIWLNVSVSDAAARTVMFPVTFGADEPDVGVVVGLLEPQAARVNAAAAAHTAIPPRMNRFVTLLFLPYDWLAPTAGWTQPVDRSLADARSKRCAGGPMPPGLDHRRRSCMMVR
jgi:hypothetical protein